MRKHHWRALAGSAATVMLCLQLAACGDGAADSSTANGPGSCDEPATGPTVKILTLLEESPAANVLQPSVHAGVDARVRAINCSGGLSKAGNKVEVSYCQSNYDPNAVNACAREAVDDDTFVAAVGGGTAAGTPATIFAEAGLPSIPRGPGQDDVTGATTYAIAPWGAQIAPGAPVLGCKLGMKKISLLLIESPAAAGATEHDNKSLRSYDCPELIKTVSVPQETTDMQSYVIAAAKDADAIVLAVSPSQTIAAFKAREQLGIDAAFLTNSGSLTADVINATGSAAEGVYVASQAYLPADGSSAPGAAQFRDDMEALGKGDLVDGYAQGAWITVDLLAEVTKDLSTVDRSSVLAALGKVSDYDAGGQLPPIDFTKAAPNPAYPRLFNDKIAFAQVNDGALVALDDAEIPQFLATEKTS